MDPQLDAFRAAQLDLCIRGASILVGVFAAVVAALPLFVGVSYITWLWPGYALWFPLPLPLCWLLGRAIVAVRGIVRRRKPRLPHARVVRGNAARRPDVPPTGMRQRVSSIT